MLNFDHIPIIDHHAPPLLRRAATADPLRFQRWFTESTDVTIHREHVPQTLVYRTAIRWLAEVLGCAIDNLESAACHLRITAAAGT